MTTPAHVVLGLAILWPLWSFWPAWMRASGLWPAVVVGALLPDLPIFVFYALESLRGVGESVIWSERYYAPAWQAFLDLPNSFPLLLLGASIGWWWKKPGLCLLFGSMALHALVDFPLHHDDGHRHFWPVSEFRFDSPVSYWDPAHYGDWVMGLEFILVVALSAWILRRHPRAGARMTAGTAAVAWGAGWLYARWVWA